MKEHELRTGKKIEYSNDDYIAEIGYNDVAHWFFIYFNGVCVHTSYTFRSAVKKFERLVTKYGLYEVQELI